MELVVGPGEREVAANECLLLKAGIVEHANGSLKEVGVEIHNVALAPEVRAHVDDIGRRADGVLYVCQCAPVAATEPVDALLDIAHDEVAAPARAALGQQGAEVLPLKARRVLKLVDHDVVELGAYLLEDEGGIARAYHLPQQDGGLGEVEARGLGIDVGHLAVDGIEQAQGLDVLGGQTGTVVATLQVGQFGSDAGQQVADDAGSGDEVGAALLVGLLHER